VLQWAQRVAGRLAQLDVSEEALAELERRVDELEAKVVSAATELTKARTKAAKGCARR
jgi:DNA repair protein RecN (Recombination protein N)